MTEMMENQQIFPRKMTLTGKGQVSTEPDQAIIRLGVQTNGDNVTIAQAENARISQDVIDSIKELGISEIQTVQYQIDKQYDYVNGERIDRGYQVRNVLEIHTNRMDQIGTIIDTAVYYGANIVESVSFAISNQEYYYQKALNLAVENAIQKAVSISNNLGTLMEPIPVLITENSTIPIPYSNTLMMREGAATTPIETGNLDVNAMVTVEFIF